MNEYHITVNGIPHCQAPVYHLCVEAGLTANQMCDCACACGYGAKKAEAVADAAKLAAALPNAIVMVAEGQCFEDPWWQTPAGREAIQIEEELANQGY